MVNCVYVHGTRLHCLPTYLSIYLLTGRAFRVVPAYLGKKKRDEERGVRQLLAQVIDSPISIFELDQVTALRAMRGGQLRPKRQPRHGGAGMSSSRWPASV